MTGGKAIAKAELLDEYYAVLHDAYAAMRAVFKRLSRMGLTQDDLAEKIGVDKALISKRLKGRENLTLKTLSFMATAMGCRLTIVFTPFDEVKGASLNIQETSGEPKMATTNSAVDVHLGLWQDMKVAA